MAGPSPSTSRYSWSDATNRIKGERTLVQTIRSTVFNDVVLTIRFKNMKGAPIRMGSTVDLRWIRTRSTTKGPIKNLAGKAVAKATTNATGDVTFRWTQRVSTVGQNVGQFVYCVTRRRTVETRDIVDVVLF
jgi:hypothetical protein